MVFIRINIYGKEKQNLHTCIWKVLLSSAWYSVGNISASISAGEHFFIIMCKFSKIVTEAWILFGEFNSALKQIKFLIK